MMRFLANSLAITLAVLLGGAVAPLAHHFSHHDAPFSHTDDHAAHSCAHHGDSDAKTEKEREKPAHSHENCDTCAVLSVLKPAPTAPPALIPRAPAPPAPAADPLGAPETAPRRREPARGPPA